MADKKEILELIEQAAKEGRTSLNLRDRQLTSLPPEVANLTNLINLDLEPDQALDTLIEGGRQPD